MDRARSILGMIAVAVLALSDAGFVALHAADDQAAAEEDTVVAEVGFLEPVLHAQGVFEPIDYEVLDFRLQGWTQPLDLIHVAAHGERVKAGDLLLEFNTEKLDRAIADLKVELMVLESAVELSRRELSAAEVLHPIELAEAERAAEVAAEDLARLLTVQNVAAEEQARFAVRVAEQRLTYAREELTQLERMYKDKDLTEETEEMILQRTRFEVEQAAQSLKRAKEASDEALTISIPRREIEARKVAEKAKIALGKAQDTLPLLMAQKRLSLAKQEHEWKGSLRKLAELEADQKAATVRAPRDGVVYLGRFRDGVWNTQAVSAKAVVGQPVKSGELELTVLHPDRLHFRVKLKEKDLCLVAPGLSGFVEPTGYPGVSLPVALGTFVPVPRDDAFGAVFVVNAPENAARIFPGMTGTARFVAEKRSNVISIPSRTVFLDDDGSRHVFVVSNEGMPVKKTVRVGLTSGNRTEIVEGLSVGDRVRVTKP